MSLSLLDNIEQYRKLFFDLVFWQPYVQLACAQAGLSCGVIRSGIAGTCPVFIVDDRYVVKFFGRLFDGEKAYQAELYADHLTRNVKGIPLPELVARGQLLESGGGWCWPFLIYKFLPGMTIGEAWDSLNDPMRLEIAAQLGLMIKRLHSIHLTPNRYFPSDWLPFIKFLYRQRKSCRKRLQEVDGVPSYFLDQIESFLLPIERLIDRNCSPHLIHADLTRDHLLGHFNNGRWVTTGLIDFGDARVGNLYYELVALHIDLFQRNTTMLQTFLENYHPKPKIREEFPLKMMNMLLLHEFGAEILGDLFILSPDLAEIDTLEKLADILWSVERKSQRVSPGL